VRPALLLAFGAACSLGGSRPDYRYYVLASRPAPNATATVSHERTLAIDRVTIPGYLEREQVASRVGGQRLAYSTADRWAEPLDRAIERTLADDLAPLVGRHGIQLQSHGGNPTYDLDVDVARFERIGPELVELRGRWALRADADVVDSGETRLRVAMAGTDSNAMVAALSEAIARMAAEIAEGVRRTDEIAARERKRGQRAERDRER
jgi:uncharacterized lipoprotein YmbA